MKVWFRSYVCAMCGNRFGERDAYVTYKRSCICRNCEKKLVRVKGKSCFECRGYIGYIIAPFYYTEPYRELFLKFKFFGDTAAGHMLGVMTAEYFRQCGSFDMFDFMTVVPLSRERFNKRGYNQSQLLAEYVSEAVGLRIENVLIKPEDRPPQSLLSGYEKTLNVAGAFELTHDVCGKSILVFDDISTTGKTLGECALVLKKGGVERVGGAVCARMGQKTELPVHLRLQ